MEKYTNNKKSEKADQELGYKKRIRFMIGLIFALLLIFVMFEWTKEDVSIKSLGELTDLTGEEEIIPITRQELEKPPEPPKPQPVVLELNIVKDDIELEDEFIIEDFEASQDEEIEIIEIGEEEEEEPEIFFIIEDMPKFQGGDQEKFRNYIQKTVVYPPLAMDNGISGTVYVNFVINPKGELTAIKIIRGVDRLLDEEVIRALKAAPKWEPGRQRGKPVHVNMSIPIKFILQ
ncbi:energy transducer TonB [archaeon]|jgi:periplasmic protein TonB|nr:energy transducer TonB [archaeon]